MYYCVQAADVCSGLAEISKIKIPMHQLAAKPGTAVVLYVRQPVAGLGRTYNSNTLTFPQRDRAAR